MLFRKVLQQIERRHTVWLRADNSNKLAVGWTTVLRVRVHVVLLLVLTILPKRLPGVSCKRTVPHSAFVSNSHAAHDSEVADDD